LSILLREFDFSLTDDPIGSDFHGLVIGPSEPCRVRYRRRLHRRASSSPQSTNQQTARKAQTGTPHGSPDSETATFARPKVRDQPEATTLPQASPMSRCPVHH